MALRHIWKIGILTTLLLFAVPVEAEPSNNAHDGTTGETNETPCDVIVWGLEAPYVDVHRECLPMYP